MITRRLLPSLGLLAAAAAALPASAQVTMYDFEKPVQFEDWTVVDPEAQTTQASTRFATTGEGSAHLSASADAVHPPRFNLRVWDNNYEPYNRIAFDITNASDEDVRFVVALIGDIDSGYRFHISVPPLTHKRVVHKIELPRFIRHDNIHFITFTAETDMPVDVYIDSIIALRKGDTAPDTKAQPLAEEVAQLRQNKVMQRLDQVRGIVHGQTLELPEAKQLMLGQLAELEKAAGKAPLSQEDAATLIDDIRKVGQTADRFEEIRGYVDQSSQNASAGFVVGFADPMTKIMPKHLRTNLDITDAVSLSLAGGEKEAFQVAIVPFRKDVKSATVRVTDLQGPGDAVLSKDVIDTDLMAYTKTVMKTESQVDYMGWWPDPIIDTDKTVEVALGDVQTWWVRIRAPRDQQAGTYTGTLTVSVDGKDLEYPMTVEVYGFNVPKHAPIPTAITYVHRDLEKFPAIGSREKWNEVKFDHTDVLNDYYINVDSIYNFADPKRLDAVDWELIEHQRKKGTLVSFNLSHFYGAKDKDFAKYKVYYDEAKKRGLLKHAYIYGYDETKPHSWPSIEASTKKMTEELPGLFSLTTSQDHSYGFNSPLEHLGGWCPIISRYNPDQAEKARELGRKVWWYTCVWPPHPYPNIFVDYPAIDNRILTGLMHMKYKPDGFLYYHTSIWKTGEGLSEFPYSNWNPNSYGKTNGDGSYFVLGADATLIPTIRVENYRDGFEDLAYYMILQHQVKQYEKAGRHSNDSWLREAKAALGQTETYVRSRTDWTKSPEDVYAYRAELASLIDASPIKDTDPWKDGMGVRGIDWN